MKWSYHAVYFRCLVDKIWFSLNLLRTMKIVNMCVVWLLLLYSDSVMIVSWSLLFAYLTDDKSPVSKDNRNKQ